MSGIMTTPSLDKNLLVAKIVEQFRHADQLYYKRALLEVFDDQGRFIGDNVFETTFKLRPDRAPLIYEVSGPYDSVSKEYATVAKVFHRGQLEFQFDLKPGIFQRTAAMVWIYLEALKHKVGRVLFLGAGKVARHTAEYLKHFCPGLQAVDYADLERRINGFETPLRELGVKASYLETVEFSLYDTIIMATTTTQCLIHEGNITAVKPGAVAVSLATTSPSGEIAAEVYARPDVNVFLDYELSKTFTGDMRKANDLGYLQKTIVYKELLKGGAAADLGSRRNIVRLTGTPLQNVAVVDLMLELEKISL